MNQEINILLTAMKEAGEAIEVIRHKGVTATQKQNNSPLTEADLAANDILKHRLLNNFPNDGWLSEETVDDAKRLAAKRVWIVDPIDGTKEFIKNIPEYAISVALIEKGQPILAAIYNSAKDEMFHAIRHQGAWCNDQPIKCSALQESPWTVLASRTELAEGRWEAFKKSHQIIPMGSIAYKLALIAKGEAQMTFTLVPKNEWDIAAGVLLVQEAGGCATQLNGQPFIFNQLQTRLPGLLASSALLYPSLANLIQEI